MSERNEMEEMKNKLLAANKARALDLLTSISLQLSNQVAYVSVTDSFSKTLRPKASAGAGTSSFPSK